MSSISELISSGGGLTPKFQEFTASGTFTPSAALIAAGGYIEVFLVGGGAQGASQQYGGTGGEVITKTMYLTSTSGISVTIGAGANDGSNGNDGGASSFNGASAGGQNLTAKGGSRLGTQVQMQSPSWPSVNGYYNGSGPSAGNGIFGYGAGGSRNGYNSSYQGGVRIGKANTGQGSHNNEFGGSGYCLIKWVE